MSKERTFTGQLEPKPARHATCIGAAMISILCIIGVVWLGGSALLMLALALASKRATPPPEAAEEMKQAA